MGDPGFEMLSFGFMRTDGTVTKPPAPELERF